MTIHIRPETPADIPHITAIIEAAFLTEAHSSHTEQFIVNGLRTAGALSLSLVAEQQGEVVGHIAASPVQIAASTGNWYGLAPLSVRPDNQQQGIGSLLVHQLLQQLKALGAAGCVVLGDPNYYGRFGFKAQAGLFYAGVPAEYMQALAFDGQVVAGEVTYHQAFGATE
jgi:putative acetyltransferase